MAEDKEEHKCAHPACSCSVPKDSKYCSDHCRKAAGITELRCGCRHPECR